VRTRSGRPARHTKVASIRPAAKAIRRTAAAIARASSFPSSFAQAWSSAAFARKSGTGRRPIVTSSRRGGSAPASRSEARTFMNRPTGFAGSSALVAIVATPGCSATRAPPRAWRLAK